MNHYINTSPEYGRGLYAAHDLLEGKVLFQCELLVFSPDDTIKVNQTDLKYYTFKYSDNQDCLVLGLGEIFNHDDKANIGYKLIDIQDRKVMLFYTLRDIKQDEQLFIDYTSDTKVDASSYTVNMI